ncbi:MAG TPA: hypothetical protein VFK30_04270, partial [Anaerolineae bacterium]|nr:hypothetical protein [Anaerolineae bacterium]
EVWYQRAVDTAKEVKAAMLELRAALKLSRLWQSQNKIDQAREVLQSAYAKITEGFNTSDMKEANVLLAELGGGTPGGS